MIRLSRLLQCALIVTAAASAFGAPPVAKVKPVTDTYFGTQVVDPYRWMEDDKDPDWLPFLRGQNEHARTVLDALPLRQALLARVRQLSGDIAAPREIQLAGKRTFYEQRPAGGNNFKLYVREKGKSRLLVDPTTMDTATSHTSLDWWTASPDGSRLAYGLSKDGSEDSVLHVMDVASGKMRPERIPNTQVGVISWLDDSSGFFYNQLTGKVNTPERFLDSRARFHKLGDDPAQDRILMARGSDPAVSFEKIQMPVVLANRHSRHALLVLADVRREKRFLTAPLADVLKGTPRWKPVADFADEVTTVDVHGDDLYMLAHRGHPRGRILKTGLLSPAVEGAREVLAQTGLVVYGMSRARDGLYVRAMDGGIGRVRRIGPDGKPVDVALPFDGTVAEVAADPDQPGALMRFSSWLVPTGIWRIEANGKVADTGITPKPAIDVSTYTTERRFAVAKDGTRIPYTLIYKKGLKKDGANPAFISAYGSYGAAAYVPAFAGRQLALIDQGAVVGFAHVRGGGEYGRDWHRAGQLENKPNTWRDLIAVCEDMNANGYTSPAHTAIGGRSAGGIPMGMAISERPELFAAVVSGVGWHNPLRYVAEQNSFAEEPEWGAISDPAGFKALRGIDSYQAVRDGTNYPAVLLTTGVTDPRVAPFHPAKMAARLQAATASGKPVLLRVDFDAGHGMGSTRSQQDEEAADTYAFILAQAGRKGGVTASAAP